MRARPAFVRAAVVASMPLLVSAAPAAQIIPMPGVDGEAVVIPRDSPVQFGRFGKDEDTAYFNGRFILTGTFSLECDYCDGPSTEKDLELSIVPDPELAARLPHWKLRNQDVKVFLMGTGGLIRAIGTPESRAEVLSHRRDDIHGRIAVEVDDFRLAIDCDSSFYSAHFIRVAKSVQLAQAQPNGDYGCA